MFSSCQIAVPVQLIVLQRIAGTIDIIKHHINLPASMMDDVADFIDNPENGMLLKMSMHHYFNGYACCLYPTDVPLGRHNFRSPIPRSL
ncbi:uncharacterized protein BJ212DRAFT_1352350 [Suillus subaureus]|uniref:HNH nuclease domain-containing protein n=1 Tax=Suillus subaureus TaxID=48587 RepID=A0A9P7EB29_9AGAM|nr:uncharacterized protein BJ212DRAFT_1352350 [Suillus subaureus]KAG1816673.1 hypothetical protein BJ212DRAFT_1352350 [Suillus subaureus]